MYRQDCRKVPKLGHVERLKDLTLVGSSIAINHKSSLFPTAILLRKGKTGIQGDLSTHNTVAALEPGCKHVHGSAFASRDPAFPTEEFSKDGDEASSTPVVICKSVTTIGGNHFVVQSHGRFHPDANGFLTTKR